MEIICCCFAEQFPRETFVGDISIIQQTNELSLPYVLGKKPIQQGFFPCICDQDSVLRGVVANNMASLIVINDVLAQEFNVEANQWLLSSVL